MAGIPLLTDSDGMSGIEPLASGSSVEVSPAPGGRSVSARSSANTAELLASTLYSVEPVSDLDDLSRPGAKRTRSDDKNGQWQDNDGQTVSSIFSPLSTEISDGNVGSLTKTSWKANVSIPGNDQNMQTASSDQRGRSKALHSSLLTPLGSKSSRPEVTTSRSLTFQSGRVESRGLDGRVESRGLDGRVDHRELDGHVDHGELDGMNQSVLDRRRDFVSKFGQDRDRGQQRQSLGQFQDSLQSLRTKIRESPDYSEDLSDQLKDYQRLSDDSTLTEHLLRGITPTEDVSPYSLPYDSGLASNLQAVTRPHTLSNLESLCGVDQSHTLSMRSERYLIQENLEKERYRRKHCELQIKELQSKLLESQQLLAVSEATQRKKDSMIAQVEKNFSKIMSDWKVKDKEKMESLERLKRDCDKHQHVVRMREQELIVREKENKELRISQERLQDELIQTRADSSSQIETMKDKINVHFREMEHAVQERVAAEQHVKKVQDMLAKERSEWREKEASFTNKLATLEEEIGKKHAEFQSTLEKETDAAKRLFSENNERRERISQLQNQLSKTLQEKESLSLEMSLKQAQFEASLQKQEMDWKEQMERLIQERTESVQEDASRQLDDQRSGHHVQIAEMTERHQDEIKRLREEYTDEMKKREARYQSSLEQYQIKLDESHQKIIKLSSKLDEVQKHRSFIIHKMQSCLQSYATDSLMMLGQLDSSPAASATQVNTHDPGGFTPMSSLQPSVSSSNQPPSQRQNGRPVVDQHFIQLMAALSSDRGYHSLPDSTDVGTMAYRHDENWSSIGRQTIDSQPIASEVHQPPPVRYDTPSLPSNEGVLTERTPTQRVISPNQQMFDGLTETGNSDQSRGHGHGEDMGWSQMVPRGRETGQNGGSHHVTPSGREMNSNGSHYVTPFGGQIGHDGGHLVTSSRGQTGINGGYHVAPSGGDLDHVSAQAQHNRISLPLYTDRGQYTSSHSRTIPHTGHANHTSTSQEAKRRDHYVDNRMGSLPDSAGGRSQYYQYEKAETDAGANISQISDYQSESQQGGNTSKRSDYQSKSHHQNNSSKRSDYQSEYSESHLQGNTSKSSELLYSANQHSGLDHYEEDHFQPCLESDTLNLSEHPLNTTGQSSLGDISQRLGKEDDRRQILQHYLKELLDQATIPGQSSTQAKQSHSRENHKTRHSLKGSRQGTGSHHVSKGQPSQHRVTSETHRPASDSLIERDIVPIKERTVPQKDESSRSGRSSAENSTTAGRRSVDYVRSDGRLSDESRASRRSINSSTHQGRSQPTKEQSTFGTSTPKKKAPRSIKPPTRKVKPKPGVWK